MLSCPLGCRAAPFSSRDGVSFSAASSTERGRDSSRAARLELHEDAVPLSEKPVGERIVRHTVLDATDAIAVVLEDDVELSLASDACSHLRMRSAR
jgi:hypothetical protein